MSEFSNIPQRSRTVAMLPLKCLRSRSTRGAAKPPHKPVKSSALPHTPRNSAVEAIKPLFSAMPPYGFCEAHSTACDSGTYSVADVVGAL